MTTDPYPGAGPRMRAAIAYIATHPGCTKAEAARNAAASYDTIERVIRRGYVQATQTSPGSNYRLFLNQQQHLVSAS